ncbi:MAG: 50S ribosomal protein L25 [Halothermotrichaceae bacterium]
MERYELKVKTRETSGKGAARKLRREGLVPAVVYGRNRDAQSLIVNPDDLQYKTNGNVIFDMKLEDEEETVMIKEIQKDPISRDIIHIDFQHISMDEKITVSVPLNLTGTAYGVQEGGVVQQLMRSIEVESLPLDIPDEIELDITDLDVGDSLLVSDIDVEEDFEIVTPIDEVIVTIVAPTELVEEEIEEEEEEFMEPEVIGEETEEEAEEAEEAEEETAE